jgi:pyridoxal phosphate enzyme (YggS family)
MEGNLGTAGIAENLRRIREEIEGIAVGSGRKSDSVRLLAVSKTRTLGEIEEARDAGQLAFGENRVQELEEKAPALPRDIEWHLIGHLQSNKAAKALRLAAWIHSVDSVSLLQRLDRLAGELEARPYILLEINVSGESSKFGVKEEDAMAELAEAAASCRNLHWKGLMTMAPFDADEATLHRVFGGLRNLRDTWSARHGIPLSELSMGMSSDYAAAIREGATIVRIGSALFGHRQT